MSCYMPSESALGAIPVIEDSVACSRQAAGDRTKFSACMIGRGYQETSAGHFERHTGIQPSTILKAALVTGALVAAPMVIPAVIKAGGSVLDAVKAGIATESSAPVAPTFPAPATSTAAPPLEASLVPSGISPVLLLLIGAGILLAFSRKG